MAEDRKVETVEQPIPVKSPITGFNKSHDDVNSLQSDSDLPSSETTVKSEGEEGGRASTAEDPMTKPMTMSLQNIIPKTNVMGIYRERHGHLPQRHLSDPIDNSSLTAKIAESEKKVSSVAANEGEETELLDKWNKRLEDSIEGLNTEQLKKPEKLKQFYILANQLLISERAFEICSMCFIRKEEYKPKSHIFPRSLLKLYADIHCKGDTTAIYDMSGGKAMGSAMLKFPLFCDECEGNASNEESLLAKLYLNIQASESDLEIELEDAHVMKHILATLMFRGILLGVNFIEEMPHSYFSELYDTFIKLWDYCHEKNREKYEKKEIAKRIHLSLLPNSHFTKGNSDPFYILDLQLRNPEFTSIVVSKDGVFLYSKFDCFHCTLPISPSKIDSLKKASVFSSNYTESSQLLPSKTGGAHLFPQVLLDYNLSQMETLAYHLFLLNNSVLMSCKIILQLHRRKLREPLSKLSKVDRESRRKSSKVDKVIIHMNEEEKEAMKRAASELSPFASYHKKNFEESEEEIIGEWKAEYKVQWNKDLKEGKKALEDKSKSEKSESMRELKAENKKLIVEKEKLLARNETLKAKYEELLVNYQP
jgi:hypothetical protein